jgi:nitrite reductase (cytochrome c-552)
MLKAQHPEFEVFSGGTHARAGISCADCHMPYMRENGRKYSSHWVTSPMKHTDASCRRCHPQEAKWLLDRVKTTQKSVWELQHTAGMTISKAHEAVAKALASPETNKGELDKAKESLRKAQWYWDFVAAENSLGFHNPPLCLNILGQSIDLAHKARESAGKATRTTP